MCSTRDFLVAQDKKLGTKGHQALLEHSPGYLLVLTYTGFLLLLDDINQFLPRPHVHKTVHVNTKLTRNTRFVKPCKVRQRVAHNILAMGEQEDY